MVSHRHIEWGRYRDPERLDGIPALAHFIGEDTEAEIFRRFNRLGARNLLHLQSNLGDLERQLDDFDKFDAENGPGNISLRQTARNYNYLHMIASPSGDDAQDEMSKKRAIERVELHKKITVAVKEYRVYKI
jgi:hypothetical protein